MREEKGLGLARGRERERERESGKERGKNKSLHMEWNGMVRDKEREEWRKKR